MEEPKLAEFNLTAEDVCKILGYHDPSYVRDLARIGKIPAIKLGRRWKFCERQIMHYINEQTHKAIKTK